MNFPYITDYINKTFEDEKSRWDFILLRPLLVVFYFFLRCVVFPLKFVLHRRAFGFEGYCIDALLSFGTKYLATYEAAELFLRHVQIEPCIYRHLLSESSYEKEKASAKPGKFNGIFGDFCVNNLKEIRWNGLTIGHDELSYEIGEHFSKEEFLANVETIKRQRPLDHEQFSKNALEENRKHSFRILGATNVVILIVITITIFGDLKTTVKALNSFDSDSIVLWCMRTIYSQDDNVLVDLEFYQPNPDNRGHYHSSVFFSDPSQYLYYHIAFDEYVYHTLMNRRPSVNS